MSFPYLNVIASAAKQSILSLRGQMDCFAALAMTLLGQRTRLCQPLPKNTLMRGFAVFLVVAPMQFIHQMLQVGGGTQGVGAQALLQPFAHGIADRAASPAVELFAGVGDSAVHSAFLILSI
jgi:hypothetical protein